MNFLREFSKKNEFLEAVSIEYIHLVEMKVHSLKTFCFISVFAINRSWVHTHLARYLINAY